MSKRNLILVIAGGIGNQLFMYATAARLAENNNADLLLDIDSRFASDSYRQTFQLDKFNIPINIAPLHLQYNQRWTRFKRNAYLKINSWIPYEKRWIILEEKDKDGKFFFDSRLLDLRLTHENTYTLDCFNSDKYFIDIREKLYKEITVNPPFNEKTEIIASEIRSLKNPVAVHARQLRGYPNVKEISVTREHKQKPFSYYEQAINYIVEKIKKPHFFCFGDDPTWLEKNWRFDYPATFVSHNNTQDEAVQDFHLMSLCRHFIMGNSGFSWWPAWLSQAENKIVVTPSNEPPYVWSSNRDAVPAGWIVI